MEDKTVDTWEKFEEEITELTKSPCLFRGQPNAGKPNSKDKNKTWELESTLYRLKKEYSCDKYFEQIEKMIPEINVYTNNSYRMERTIEMIKKIVYKDDSFLDEEGVPEFLIYLRQNGFPSPLLDWTKSPYIAAFFAYRNIFQSKRSHVAIYVIKDYINKALSDYINKALSEKIIIIGDKAVTEKKHFIQQAHYTVYLKKNDSNELVFARDQELFRNSPEKFPKYYLPIIEQKKVLRKLDSMNINAYSLFGTEEALMETLAMRHLYLNE